MILWLLEGRNNQLSAIILDGRILQSISDNRVRADYDGAKGKKGSKVR